MVNEYRFVLSQQNRFRYWLVALLSLSGLTEMDEIVKFNIVVDSVDDGQLIVLDAGGGRTIIENQAWCTLDAAFYTSTGDALKLTGFYDGGVFEAISLFGI